MQDQQRAFLKTSSLAKNSDANEHRGKTTTETHISMERVNESFV